MTSQMLPPSHKKNDRDIEQANPITNSFAFQNNIQLK